MRNFAFSHYAKIFAKYNKPCLFNWVSEYKSSIESQNVFSLDLQMKTHGASLPIKANRKLPTLIQYVESRKVNLRLIFSKKDDLIIPRAYNKKILQIHIFYKNSAWYFVGIGPVGVANIETMLPAPDLLWK